MPTLLEQIQRLLITYTIADILSILESVSTSRGDDIVTDALHTARQQIEALSEE